MNVKENICGLISGMPVFFVHLLGDLRSITKSSPSGGVLSPKNKKRSRHANHPNDMLLQYGLQRMCSAYYLKMTCYNDIRGAINQLQTFTLKISGYLSKFEEDISNQPTNEPTNQTTNQPASQPTNQQTNQPNNQLTN